MNKPAKPLYDEDTYEDVERAVMETARGRWFLAEYARRQGSSDTKTILAAIARLEDRIAELAGPTNAAMQPPVFDMPAAPAAGGVMQETPIDALMNRLTAALQETSRTMREVELQSPPPLASFAEIEKLAPEERLRLFY